MTEAAGEEDDGQAGVERGQAGGLTGVRVIPATPTQLRRAGLPAGLRGLFVTSVEPPATHARLYEGDLIVEVNHRRVESLADLRRAVEEGPKTALVAVRRGRGTHFLAIPKDSAGGWRRGESY